MNQLSSVYHDGAGVRMLKELARSDPDHQQRSRTSHEPSEGDLSRLGYTLVPGKKLYAPRHRAE